jgi:hypothetical protein
MAAYPTYKQQYGSTRESTSGTQVDRAESGKARFRSFYPGQYHTFRIVHECTTAEKNAILAHYGSNHSNSFSFNFAGDGANYTVRYVEIPKATAVTGNIEWVVETLLVTV